MQDIKRVQKIKQNIEEIDLRDPNRPDIETRENFRTKLEPKPSKIKIFFKFSIYFFIFIIISFFVFSSGILSTDPNSESWFYKLPIISQVRHLAESANKSLKGEDLDRINILLLGMGGKYHEGGYLTDTIMLASLEPSTNKVSLLSIPRDLSIPMEDMGWRKINNVNAFAEFKKKDSGGLAISQALSDVLNIPIDYYLRIDFEGFTNVVNELDKIDVYVENTLEDFSYPIMGMEDAEPYESRFEHLFIEKGWQEMDGSLALKYARSRHAYGVEGSDFARAKRQQIIIQAVKDKLLSKSTLFNPKIITNIVGELTDHLSTNLKIWEMVQLWNKFKDVNKENIYSRVLDNSPNGLLIDSRGNEGTYILTPRSGDFSEIQYLVHNIFSDAPVEYRSKVTTEETTIEIINGTWINGLASETALDLERFGFEVIRVGNSSKKNFQKSVIYDLTFGDKSESLSILKEKTNANIAFELPEWLINDITKNLTNETSPEKPDFLLVLGQNADETNSGTENEEE